MQTGEEGAAAAGRLPQALLPRASPGPLETSYSRFGDTRACSTARNASVTTAASTLGRVPNPETLLRQPRRHARIQQRQEAQERERDHRGQHAARVWERAPAPPPPAEPPVRAALARIAALLHIPVAGEGAAVSPMSLSYACRKFANHSSVFAL